MKLQNSAGDKPYLFQCPWCEAKAGCLCQDLNGKEYTDGSFHRARLMKDCLEQDKKGYCDCGDELVSEEDFRTGMCGICRSLETGVEEIKE